MIVFSPRLRIVATFAILTVVLVVLVASGRARVSTELFELLPGERRDPIAAAAMSQSRDMFFRDVSIAISAPSEQRDELIVAAHALIRMLHEAPLALRDSGQAMAEMTQAFAAHRFRLLTAEDREAMLATPVDAFREAVMSQMARPGRFDAADPGGYLDRYLAGLPGPSEDWSITNGIPVRVANGRAQVFLGAELAGDPLDPELQQALDHAFSMARETVIARCNDCTLEWTGAVRFSQATREAAETDVKRLSSVALVGITLLFLFGFRSARPLLAGFAVLAAAVLAGLSASFAVFGSVHALTLVFGTTLIGLCIDYVLHLLVHRWAHPGLSPVDCLRTIAPGLALGLATSSLAFIFLLFAGFPALSQIAVFSLAGLLTAWLLVHAWLPFAAAPAPGNKAPIPRWITQAPQLNTYARALTLAILLVLAGIGLPRLHVVDDVRGLQAVTPTLADSDRAVRRAMQGMPGSGMSADFLLIEAADLDTALETEHRLFQNSENGFGLSRFLPPASERARNLDAWAPLFEPNGEAHAVLKAFGFRDSAIAALAADFERSRQADASAALLDSPALQSLRWLHIETANGVALVSRVPGMNVVPEGFDNVRVVQPLRTIEQTFGEIRHRAVLAVAAAYLLMLLLLSYRYGLIGGVRALTPAAFGALVALGMLGLAGLPLNIFSLVALILVLGIGADYALFLREGATHFRTVRLATAMAAATSLLSFGLLMMSSLPALQAFGFATASGILAAYLAAPLAVKDAPETTRGSQLAAIGEAQ